MMSAFTYRTFNSSPSNYERELANTLFTIMTQRVYDPAEIAAQLNKAGLWSANGKTWTAALLKSEMQRLGTWTNCIGGPVGSHSLPGASERKSA